MNDPLRRVAIVAASLTVLCASSACAIGPRYVRPEAPSSPAYREALPAGWEAASPIDSVPRGAWWTVYNEPGLDALEGQVSIANQNVLAAEAQFRAAKAAVSVSRSGQFPVVAAGPSATRSDNGAAPGPQTTYEIPIDATYQVDVWGSIRHSVAANAAVAQASAAELENARLLYQAELASDYFQLQGLDAEQRLLQSTVQSYEEYVQLTQDRYQGGVVSLGDVALAQTQLETARAQLADLSIARAQFEHAIAVLVGRSPADLVLPAEAKQSSPPIVPVGLPSSLLERRPDIAAAERQIAAANAQIGVAKAAFYPSLSFSGGVGATTAAIADLLTVPTHFWSLGAAVAETIFDGGKRHAQVRLTEASYDATVATYRQTVLTGLQQVEDDLAELRVLSDETEIVGRATAAAQQSLDISTTQYRGGLTNYLTVITAQTSLLQNQRSAVDLVTRRLVTSVSLIEALGGGWDASQLPSSQDVRR